jgi:hypothetical protein
MNRVSVKALLGLVSIIFLILLVVIFLNPYLLIQGVALVTPYKTQSIVYRNIDDPEVTIEFQMKDIGARGYLKRTVRVEPGVLWDSVSKVDIGSIDEKEWQKVNEYVNEHGLKGS